MNITRTNHISRWGNRLLLFLNAGLLAWAMWFISTRKLTSADPAWDYKDLVTILLAAIGVLLAMVAIFLALLAFWGYNALKDVATEAAGRRAELVAERVAREVAGPIAARSSNEAAATDEGQAADLSKALKEED